MWQVRVQQVLAASAVSLSSMSISHKARAASHAPEPRARARARGPCLPRRLSLLVLRSCAQLKYEVRHNPLVEEANAEPSEGGSPVPPTTGATRRPRPARAA